MRDWRDQEVHNEARSRDRNEWMEDIRADIEGEGIGPDVYVCECGDESCRAEISLTHLEYEDVRGYSTRFAIAVDHENPEIDQLVSEGGRYAVVQKIAGMPARIARETDLRRMATSTKGDRS